MKLSYWQMIFTLSPINNEPYTPTHLVIESPTVATPWRFPTETWFQNRKKIVERQHSAKLFKKELP